MLTRREIKGIRKRAEKFQEAGEKNLCRYELSGRLGTPSTAENVTESVRRFWMRHG